MQAPSDTSSVLVTNKTFRTTRPDVATLVVSNVLRADTVHGPGTTGTTSETFRPFGVTEPQVELHVTESRPGEAPATVAVKFAVSPRKYARGAALTATEMEATRTVTVAEAALVGAATLVAVTLNGPPLSGAVHVAVPPLPTMEPPLADQVTALFVALATVAENVAVPPASTAAVVGVMLIVTAGGGATDPPPSPPPPPQAAKISVAVRQARLRKRAREERLDMTVHRTDGSAAPHSTGRRRTTYFL